ncbi:hypothetical protein QQS21_009555 [Conoideocrella luteorostrata]|uniref:Uncharacterized protein n=1 Tax=Conoideocrella luteorostrata TaxID=1105319 RepID=A0AAJ0FQ78_9HYPO|nr:hypothetical protein QQS21_009555 [Conoideocrella luteorostrata]
MSEAVIFGADSLRQIQCGLVLLVVGGDGNCLHMTNTLDALQSVSHCRLGDYCSKTWAELASPLQELAKRLWPSRLSSSAIGQARLGDSLGLLFAQARADGQCQTLPEETFAALYSMRSWPPNPSKEGWGHTVHNQSAGKCLA